ncbi:hypothetical protein ACOME3_001841 [Neoechinorhynchus agilis]
MVIEFPNVMLNGLFSDTFDTIPSAYAFSSFFYVRLSAKDGYKTVKRWTRKVDIFSYDILFIPVHQNSHWTLVSVHLKEKEIRYYDSLGTKSNNVSILNTIYKYLETEHEARMNGEVLGSYGWVKAPMPCPRQDNCDDCGVFLCQVAERVARNAPITFVGQNTGALVRNVSDITGKLATILQIKTLLH